MSKNKDAYYDNRIVFKPWGHEYVVYRYKNILSVTLLNINPNKSTSLHCHPIKKTGFVLLEESLDRFSPHSGQNLELSAISFPHLLQYITRSRFLYYESIRLIIQIHDV